MSGLFGGGQKSTSTVDKMAAGMRFQTSAFGLAWTILIGRSRLTGNLVDYQNFKAIPHTESQTQGQGGKGGGGATSSHTSFTYQVALALGLCAGPLAEDAIKTIWVAKEKKYGTNGQIGSSVPGTVAWSVLKAGAFPSPTIFDLMAGAVPQEPWDWMVTAHPERALGYHGLACAVASAFDLGDNENLANIGLEMVGLLPYDQEHEMVDWPVTLPSDAQETQSGVLIPGSPYQVTVTYGSQWTRDISVTDVTDPENPVVFTKVAGSPGAQQYSVTDKGQYTFNVADVGKTVDIVHGRQTDAMIMTVPETLHFVSSQGVKNAAGAAMTEVGSADPCALDEYIDHGQGQFEFSRFNSGQVVKISWTFNEQLGAVADDILKLVWGNSLIALGQNLDLLEDLTDWRNYVLAQNWLLSPVLTAQETAKDFLERLLEITNSDLVWRSGKIGVIPRGDTQVSGNGVIWMPEMSSLFSFTPDHFLVDNQPPLKWQGITPQDAYNHVQVEFLNKDNEYNTEPAEYKDEVNVEDQGLKTDDNVYKYHEITFKEMAQQVAQNKVNQYLFQADQYSFSLPWHFGRYEPGDKVDLTDLGLSLESQLVRLLKKTIDQDGCFEFVAEALDLGSGTPGSHNVPEGQGYAPDHDVAPGDVNTPVIFVPPANLIDTEMEVWAAVSGGADWGGCNIWVSESGEDYKFVGQMIGPSRHGVLSANLPSSANSPDTVNTLSVDLSTSRGSLLSGTQQDAEELNTLCKVGDEYLAYKTATLTAQYKYDLTWLVRGCYGSGMLLRATGSSFVRLDDAVFKYLCKRSDIGRTLYIKFQSFNVYMRKVQDLSDIDPYVFTVTSPGDAGQNPVLGLTAGNNSVSPNSKIDVAFNSCPAYDSGGNSYEIGALGFTINSGVVGLNGKDVAGALAPNSIYYYFAIANGVSGSAGGLLSSSSSSPTLPSGYTYKRLLGPAYTDGSGHLVGFNQVGDEWLYDNVQLQDSGSTAENWTDQDCSGLIPPISTRGKFSLQVVNVDSADVDNFGLRRNGSTATLGQLQGSCLAGLSARADGWCDTDENQVVELNIEAGLQWLLYVAGFYISV